MACKNNLPQKGVVILFAVLMVSVILTISLGIFNIVYRQLLLSSMARESEIAFAVADSARNCALYWDDAVFRNLENAGTKFGYYKDNGGGNWELIEPTASPNQIACGGSNLDITLASVVLPDYYTTTFMMPIDINGKATCAVVTIAKKDISSGADRETRIIADGYNIQDGPNCVPQSDSNLSRAVNRTLVSVIKG